MKINFIFLLSHAAILKIPKYNTFFNLVGVLFIKQMGIGKKMSDAENIDSFGFKLRFSDD
jgi:hypothetical protein